MPRQIQSSEQFQKLLPKAQELRVVRTADFVKLKLRMPDLLYTYKTNEDEAEDLIKSAKYIEVIEYTPVEEKKKEKESESPNEEKKQKEGQPPKQRKSK